MTSTPWYSGTVLRGDQYGRTLGFPTVNFDPRIIDTVLPPGVYAATVGVNGKQYAGALYFGPRITLRETTVVLEIHIIDFHGNLYDQAVRFQIGTFIRPPMDFATTDELRTQLEQDIRTVKTVGNTKL